MRRRLVVQSGVIAFFLLAPVMTSGQESLKENLGDVEVGKHWIYGDWKAAKETAAKEKKPIFALFR